MLVTNQSLSNKKILFISPSFFGYEEKIVSKLEAMGATVTYYDERSVKSPISRSLLKLSPKIFTIYTNNYYQHIINKNINIDFDFVFIIKAEMITSESLSRLRESYNNARFCLYLWDSIRNVKGVEKKFKYFDKIFTFDKQDSVLDPNLFFRPLFYIDEFESRDENYHATLNYEISFLGTIHSDRYKVIRSVLDLSRLKKWNVYFFCYLQSRFVYYLYKVLKSEFRDTRMTDFSYSKLNYKSITQVVEQSRTILDINHPNQTGLTIRTIEMIGMCKKLITTNEKIVDYDFYNPNNILVIQRDSVRIPDSFIMNSYEPIKNEILEKYTLESWIKEILEVV